MSGAIIDPDRLVIGTEEGLFCLDLDRSGKSLRLSNWHGLLCISVMQKFYFIFRQEVNDSFT